MSNTSLLSARFFMRRQLEALVLALVPVVAGGCATIAGFEDFSSKGQGGNSSVAGSNANVGGAYVPVGGQNNGGGGLSLGGSESTGGLPAATGGQPATCGAVGQPCCALNPSCANNGCCFNGNCISPGASCGSVGTSTTPSTCQAGHCTNCGQAPQACCAGTSCEFGYECAPGTGLCRVCGASGESCCDNNSFPRCDQGSVCVSSNGTLQSVCSVTCGASGHACCTGNPYTGTGCQEGTNLTCVGGTCQ